MDASSSLSSPACTQQQQQQDDHWYQQQQQEQRRRRRACRYRPGTTLLFAIVLLACASSLWIQRCDAQTSTGSGAGAGAGAGAGGGAAGSSNSTVMPPPSTSQPPVVTQTPRPSQTTQAPTTTAPPPPVTTRPPPVTTAPPVVTPKPQTSAPATPAPSPSETPEPTTTAPPSPSPTPTTRTPQLTMSPAMMLTATPTPVPDSSPSPSPSSNPSPTPSSSPSPSPSPTPSPTPKLTPPVVESTSAILPSVSSTPDPAVSADTTSQSSGSGNNSVALAIIVAGVVGTVLAGAIFVYVKTAKRQEEIKREFDSASQRPPPTTDRGSLQGQYQQLSPSRRPNPGYDAYAAAGGAGAAVAAGIARGPPGRHVSDNGHDRTVDSISDPIDLNDPNFDVLTPLSDIAMAGGGYTESFNGGTSGHYPTQHSSTSSRAQTNDSSGSVFYDPNATVSELYPGALMSSAQNDVSGSDDSSSDEEDDIGSSSFDSQSTFDMPSVSEWNAPDTRGRGESDAISVVFSVGSESRETAVYEDDDQYKDSEVSSGLHDHSASTSSYSEYSTNFSEFGRSTAVSDFSEYNNGSGLDASRFNSTVFSDVDGVEGADAPPRHGSKEIDIDSDSDSDGEGYDGNSFSSDIASSIGNDSFIDPSNNNSNDDDLGASGGSFSSSDGSDGSDDDDIVSGSYGFDDDDDDDDDGEFNASSFESNSSYDV